MCEQPAWKPAWQVPRHFQARHPPPACQAPSTHLRQALWSSASQVPAHGAHRGQREGPLKLPGSSTPQCGMQGLQVPPACSGPAPCLSCPMQPSLGWAPALQRPADTPLSGSGWGSCLGGCPGRHSPCIHLQSSCQDALDPAGQDGPHRCYWSPGRRAAMLLA